MIQVERDFSFAVTVYHCTECAWKLTVTEEMTPVVTIYDVNKYCEAELLSEDEVALRTMSKTLPDHWHPKEWINDLQPDHH